LGGSHTFTIRQKWLRDGWDVNQRGKRNGRLIWLEIKRWATKVIAWWKIPWCHNLREREGLCLANHSILFFEKFILTSKHFLLYHINNFLTFLFYFFIPNQSFLTNFFFFFFLSFFLIKNSKFFGVITFSSHELPTIVNMPPRTDTSTIREHSTSIYVPLPHFVS
jgi:hypothetical protein